ncbi:Hpt domain-containing protein [Sulfurimonas sp.]|nr:Hpt domain-containing protein [Sulfurimonas sp.]
MLIYNHKKEFIGIDEQDLHTLGFASLEDLKVESTDFADFFVKTPGYVHNFKHVNWIDFVACADSTESTKVIIRVNGRDFRSLLEIKTVYLLEDESSKAFLIYLTNMREIQDSEENDIPENFISKPTPVVPAFIPPKEEITDIIEVNDEIEEAPFYPQEDISIEEIIPPSIDLDAPIELDYEASALDEDALEEDLKIDLDIHDDLTQTEETIETEISTEVFDNGYIFDPKVASEELGLPVDLIEEFIEDFIAQAKEFKQDLYTSLDDGDDDNVKIQSHKLKGVAANLRIEDALESLTIINTSENTTDIKKHLDIFYKIISKLAGEKVQVTKNTSVDTSSDTDLTLEVIDEEIETLDFKDDYDVAEPTQLETLDSDEEDEDLDLDIFDIQETKVEIEEDEVPMKIDIPELADDNFLKMEEQTTAVEELDMMTFPDEIEAEPIKQTRTINYDKEYIAREIGLSQENFMELFEDYLEEANSLSKSISDAIEENEPQKWKSKAIQLKGMSDNMRINDLIKDIEVLIGTEDSSIAQSAHLEIQDLLTEISKLKG